MTDRIRDRLFRIEARLDRLEALFITALDLDTDIDVSRLRDIGPLDYSGELGDDDKPPPE